MPGRRRQRRRGQTNDRVVSRAAVNLVVSWAAVEAPAAVAIKAVISLRAGEDVAAEAAIGWGWCCGCR